MLYFQKTNCKIPQKKKTLNINKIDTTLIRVVISQIMIMPSDESMFFMLGPVPMSCTHCLCRFSLEYKTNTFTQRDDDTGRGTPFIVIGKCPDCRRHFSITFAPPTPSVQRSRQKQRRKRKHVDPELFRRAKRWLKENKYIWKGRVSYHAARRMAIHAFKCRQNRLAKSSCGESCGSDGSDYECSSMIWKMIQGNL